VTDDLKSFEAGVLTATRDAPLARFRGDIPPAPAWFDAAIAQQPERSRIFAASAEIELLTWGDVGKPGLLFLHGNGAHADWWSFIAPFFALHWRVAALSWSGMGASTWRDRYTLEQFGDEIAAAIDAATLNFDGVAPVAVGHSFGGFPLMWMAAHKPQSLRCAVLVDSVVQRPDRRWAVPPRSGQPVRVYATLEQALARFRFAPPQSCENFYIADWIARRSLKRAPLQDGCGDGWTWRFDPQLYTSVDPDALCELLPRLKVPTAMIWGERSRLMDAQTLEYMLGQMPSGPRVAIPDASHHVMVDQPLAFITALRGLLAGWLPTL
jgi:pimeloyl-ACP methyl ester carboxylesterase